jgi:hypothetical protein
MIIPIAHLFILAFDSKNLSDFNKIIFTAELFRLYEHSSILWSVTIVGCF